ncbi:MAG: family epimerase/isomerase [Caulobacter sp.]|nr:family epimerase/isomerase [Caulobacter sp.]
MVDGPRSAGSHRAWLEAEAQRLYAFALGARLDRGFGWLDADGRVEPDRPRALWINARFTHVFALADMLGYPGAGALCEHGVKALLEDFADPEHGGWFAEVGPDGPVRTDKEAYGSAFVILALSSATQAGRPGARQALRAALDTVARRFWREDEGAVCEAWDRDWSTCEAYRGANANMHMVEAFLAASEALDDELWAQRALRIAERLIDGVARANGWRVAEHFDTAWTPLPDYNADNPDHPFRPYGITPGHGLEWARLLIGLRVRLADSPAWLMEAAAQLFARATAEGWAEPGGFVYTTHADGRPCVERRLHWVVTEAIAAAATLQEATGEGLYEDWYRRSWAFAAGHLIDRERGSWRHELDTRLHPVAGVWAGKPDVYHAFQAVLIPGLPLAGSVAGSLKKHQFS